MKLSVAALVLLLGSVSRTAVAQVPQFDHVIVIVMENREYGDIIDNLAAPYINDLARRYGVATNDFAVVHPSLPNYMALTSGQTFFADNCLTCQTNAINLMDRIEASGRTWTAYMEDMPGACATSDYGLYVTRHNPFVHYTDIVGNATRCSSHVVPFSDFSGDLANGRLAHFVWITPNVCNDMHDCPVATGDAWLSSVIEPILASPAFANSLLVLTWDEGITNDGGGGHVPLLIASPRTPAGRRVSTSSTHYSVLRTIEDAWGLTPLGESATALPLSEFFPAPAPATPSSPNPGDGVRGVTVTPTLSWHSAGATSYEIRIGTTNPPLLAVSSTADYWYSSPTLNGGTTYFWQIVAKNAGGSTSGPVWSFTTETSVPAPILGPSAPSSPNPGDGARGVTVTPTLSWQSAGATSYEIAFGTTNPPPIFVANIADHWYSFPTLNGGTTYFWRIVAKNASGATAGPIWSFATEGAAPPPPMVGPVAPSAPNPADATRGVTSTPILSWQSIGATSYEIRFGTVNPPPVVVSNTTDYWYNSLSLNASTTYFWQIVARNSSGATPGPVWSFTTR